MFISVTRLRVRRWIDLPPFLWWTRSAQSQVLKAPGFVGGRLLVDRHRTFWTLTAWENERAMKAYRGSGAHSQVMPKLMRWCDEAAYTHWEAADSQVPSWPEAYQQLLRSARLSRVAHPSPAHEARLFEAPRLKPLVGGDLRPKSGPP